MTVVIMKPSLSQFIFIHLDNVIFMFDFMSVMFSFCCNICSFFLLVIIQVQNFIKSESRFVTSCMLYHSYVSFKNRPQTEIMSYCITQNKTFVEALQYNPFKMTVMNNSKLKNTFFVARSIVKNFKCQMVYNVKMHLFHYCDSSIKSFRLLLCLLSNKLFSIFCE